MSELIKALGLARASNEAGDWLQRRLRSGLLLQIVSSDPNEMTAPCDADDEVIAVIWTGSFDARVDEVWGCTLQTIAAELRNRGYEI